MTREEFDEAKRVSAEIAEELKRSDLTPEQRAQLEHHQTKLAGVLSSTWLPFGWWRRAVMLVLLLLGLLWPLGGSVVWVVAWLLMLSFSPRVVGEVVHALGRFFGGLKDGAA